MFLSISFFSGGGLESAVIDSQEAIQVFWRKKTETREAASTPPTLSNLIFVATLGKQQEFPTRNQFEVFLCGQHAF